MSTDLASGNTPPKPTKTQAQLIHEQQQRVQRNFNLSVNASWVILLLFLAFLFSGLRTTLGPFKITTIHLDTGFIGDQITCTRNLISGAFSNFAFVDNTFCISGGVGQTIAISAVSILFASLLALLAALGRLSRLAPVYAFSTFYVSLIRGTPLLLQILFFFLALPQLGIILSGFSAGVLALGINYGAYMSEIFRAGILSVGKGQREAAMALGMNPLQTMRRIILPQALRFAIPPTGNEFIAMLKDSALVSTTGFAHEILWRATRVGRANFRNLEALVIAALFYWVMTILFSALQARLEKYMSRGDR